MDKINIKINNVDYQVDAGQTVLDACHSVGIDIPTLCWMRDLNEIGACRMCVVEVKGARTLVTACVYPVNDGMEIVTNSDTVYKARKTNLELLLSTHDQNCLSCVRSTDCELQTLCNEYGVDGMRFTGTRPRYELEKSSLHLVRDNNKCVLCRRCVAACQQQHVGVIAPSERGFNTHIACAFEAPLSETGCISCGQCIVACPTGALTERDDTAKVMEAISDPTKTVIVHTAPSIRATLGEAFGLPVGTFVEGKMVAALRRLGFDKVFDTDTAADFTIMEEAHEFLERVKNGGKLPLLTSCCPGWSKFLEMYHPEFFENISTCKSPQGMMGGLVKTYWAQKNGIDPKDIFVVSIMPCTAKKFELDRYDMHAAGEGIADNDVSLTTRELARMIKRAGLDFANLPDEAFDEALGESTGAAVIFGASGGVLEAALRTAAAWITGADPVSPDFTEVRGEVGAKEATYTVGDIDVKVCSVSGMANVESILRAVNAGEKDYHIIEIMACPGGCVNGGGQPSQPAKVRNFTDLKTLRAAALYSDDAKKVERLSHNNVTVQKVYDEFLEHRGSHKCHDILHTSYQLREFKY
ncbi:MAG: [FeFe] hydrogenase, group A [Clostridiales Family XIII bacterium]|jgi:NADP-reducing hydrogenase subunit HndD|nr:[FeFe] hydrogenase, group A [Clostridiales Family XIII bacterium]